MPPGYAFKRLRSNLFLIIRALLFTGAPWTAYITPAGALVSLSGLVLVGALIHVGLATRDAVAVAATTPAMSRAASAAALALARAQRNAWAAACAFSLVSWLYTTFVLQIAKRLRWAPPPGWVRLADYSATKASHTAGTEGGRTATEPAGEGGGVGGRSSGTVVSGGDTGLRQRLAASSADRQPKGCGANDAASSGSDA